MLAETECLDTGKPLRQAQADITVAARYFEFYARASEAVYGETIPISGELLAYTLREPHGVTGHIIPWNYPAQITARTLAPALVMGNACVLKPAEDAPLTPLRIAELAHKAGLPPGVLNVVPGLGEQAGAALAGHPGLGHISFTGSPEVGRLVGRAAAESIIPVTLELGGKSPNIVFADADLERAAPTIVNSILQNAGQTCSAGSRLLVERSAQPHLVELLRERFAAVRIGRGIDDPDLGPLISATQLERVRGYVERGRDSGRLVIGGGSPDDAGLGGGYFFPPTLFDDVAPDSPIAREEVFGPVVVVTAFDSEDEAVALANGTDYGLIAAVWTRDVARAHRVAHAVRVGQVYINTYGAGGGVELPFGGYKHSGFGREKGFEALLGYTRTKAVAVRLDD
jgi:aldehyde dehydrogenase (NAD+)/betaine-aldehyde dehydrogenase